MQRKLWAGVWDRRRVTFIVALVTVPVVIILLAPHGIHVLNDPEIISVSKLPEKWWHGTGCLWQPHPHLLQPITRCVSPGTH